MAFGSTLAREQATSRSVGAVGGRGGAASARRSSSRSPRRAWPAASSTTRTRARAPLRDVGRAGARGAAPAGAVDAVVAGPPSAGPTADDLGHGRQRGGRGLYAAAGFADTGRREPLGHSDASSRCSSARCPSGRPRRPRSSPGAFSPGQTPVRCAKPCAPARSTAARVTLKVTPWTTAAPMHLGPRRLLRGRLRRLLLVEDPPDRRRRASSRAGPRGCRRRCRRACR